MHRRSRIAYVKRGEKRPRHRGFLHDYHRHFVFISAEGVEIESSTTNRRQGDPPGMKKAGSSAALPAQPLTSASGFATAAALEALEIEAWIL